ncbi:MAG: response regulator transcription factor [Cyanobacteria bacterium K_DeepCast_35m_m2_023]|nr:response regulator transcription factor [Cyanobacteria bacterium K_DeepCast_35m_m2_023]
MLHPPATTAATVQLSPREREVLSLLAQGQNNADIAAALVIALDTVKTHVRNLLLKLGARGRTHAAVLAIERGLVDWPQTALPR